MIDGLVFNLQRFSTDDGDGIRTCVFLKGCPLRCAWCHNAEGLSSSPELALRARLCLGCGACVRACPSGALSLTDGIAALDRTRCVVCGECVEACPTGALERIGGRMTVDEVLSVIRRDAIFYGTRGGLTVTGGEPMAQSAFTLALARAAHDEGLSVFVETSGFGRQEDFLALVPYCDVFLFDCKAASADHRRLIGVEDAVILENLDAVCRAGARVRLRCPTVQGANLCEAFVEKIIALASAYDGIECVQLMPYHQTGCEKPIDLGADAQRTFETPDGQLLEALARRIERESRTPTFY